MQHKFIIIIVIINCGMLWAQDRPIAIMPPGIIVEKYLSEANELAALYNGKVETAYDRRYANHPYLESDDYTKGILCYNHVTYQDVLMRFDLYRDEITVISTESPYHIVLEKEKFEYALLNGMLVVMSVGANDSKEKLLVLLNSGMYPVVRKYKVSIQERLNLDRTILRSFSFQHQYAIYINGIPHTVKNKNSVLKLFADRKKELNEFAKQHKLDFNKLIEQSIIALVHHYENLNK